MRKRKRAKTTTKNGNQGAIFTSDNSIYTALNQTTNPETQRIGNHAIRFALASGDAHKMKGVKENYA